MIFPGEILHESVQLLRALGLAPAPQRWLFSIPGIWNYVGVG